MSSRARSRRRALSQGKEKDQVGQTVFKTNRSWEMERSRTSLDKGLWRASHNIYSWLKMTTSPPRTKTFLIWGTSLRRLFILTKEALALSLGQLIQAKAPQQASKQHVIVRRALEMLTQSPRQISAWSKTNWARSTHRNKTAAKLTKVLLKLLLLKRLLTRTRFNAKWLRPIYPDFPKLQKYQNLISWPRQLLDQRRELRWPIKLPARSS